MYSKKRKSILFFIFALLAACSPTATITTATPIPLTKTLIPFSTDTSTPMPSTNTPTPSFDGPKLIYKAYKEGLTTSVEMMNKDGTGRKTLLMPEDGEVYFLSNAVSPDGKWLAFHSGTTDDHNLTLNILSITSGEKQIVSSLISKDYPDNFQKAVDKIRASKEDFSKNDEISASTMAMNFSIGVINAVWSPDSRYLAFGGEMDGPTSDLYVYDMQEKMITRLTNDLLNINSMRWSPDGSMIYFNNGLPGRIYSSDIYYSINFESKKIQKLDIPGWGQYDDCVSAQFCLSHFQGDGGDPHDIAVTDMNTGKSKILWAQFYQNYAIAPSLKGIVTSGYSTTPNPGTYFVDFNGNQKKISDLYFGELTFLDGSKPLLIGGRNDGIFTITLNGIVQKIYDTSYYNFSISPDKNMFIGYVANFDEPQAQGLIFFTKDGKFIRQVGKELVREIVWRPDSLGLFYRADRGRIHYLSIPNGDPVDIPDSADISLSETVWIP